MSKTWTLAVKYGPFQSPERPMSTQLVSAENVSMWAIATSLSSSISSWDQQPCLLDIPHTKNYTYTHTLCCWRGHYWKSISTLPFFARIEKWINGNDLPQVFCLLESRFRGAGTTSVLFCRIFLAHCPVLGVANGILFNVPTKWCVGGGKRREEARDRKKEGKAGGERKSLKKRKYSFQNRDINL